MKWIILATIAFIVPYTYLTLHYRKPGPSYQPYEDALERESIARSGYRRVTIRATRPDDARSVGSPVTATAAGGLPEDLRRTLLTQPILPDELGSVSAPASEAEGDAYPIQFDCTQSDMSQQLAGAQIYIKGTGIFVVADFERLSGGLSARSRRNAVRLTLPPGALTPGRYRFTLVGLSGSRTWTLQVH